MKKTLLIIPCMMTIVSFPQSWESTDSLKKALYRAIDDTAICQLNIEIGDHYNKNYPDTALIFYKRVLRIALASKLIKYEATALQKIGVVHYYKGDYSQALSLYKDALHIHTQLNNQEGISSCYNNIGIIYGLKGLYNQTLEYFLKSLEIDESMGDQRQIAYSYNNIGNVYRCMNLLTEAGEYYEKAQSIFREMNDENGLLASYSNLGNIANKRGNYEIALDNFKKGLELARRVEKVGIPVFYTNIGNSYSNMARYGMAEAYLAEALTMYQTVGNEQGMSKSLAELSANKSRQGSYREAIENAQESLALAEQIDVVPLKAEASESLFNAYEGLHDYKKALKYHKLFKRYSDSIVNIDHTQLINDLQAGVGLIRKEKENELLRQENEIQELELARQKSIRNFFIALSVLVIVLIVFSYSRNRIKKKINQTLSEKNELITQQKEQLKKAVEELKDSNQQLQLKKNEFEDQAKALQVSESKLENQRQHLEVLVEERTRDLKEKVEELEKYHDLFVQREFRIKELKEQLNALQ